MTILQEIRDLWQTNEIRPIGSVMKQLVGLLEEARDKEEKIPLDLETEILLAANYAYGYGGHPHESKTLFLLLHRVLAHSSSIPSSQLHRLGCTVASSFLTQLVSDTQMNSNQAREMLDGIGIQASSLKSQVQAVADLLLQVLEEDFINTWSLELISFIITYRSILAVMNETSKVGGPSSKTQLAHQVESHQRLIMEWKSHWLEKEDYFRFVTLMLLDKHAPEDLWKKQAQSLTGLS